jgi:hypothetical protein
LTQLTTAIKAALRRPDPVVGLLSSTIDLPDARFTGEQLQAAAKAAGVFQDQQLAARLAPMLQGIQYLQKSGDRVWIVHDQQTDVPLIGLGDDGNLVEKAEVRFQPTATYTVHRDGDAITMSDIQGIEGEKVADGSILGGIAARTGFHSVTGLRFSEDPSGIQVAHVDTPIKSFDIHLKPFHSLPSSAPAPSSSNPEQAEQASSTGIGPAVGQIPTGGSATPPPP